MSLEKRIDRICDFGGSLPPRKPSTRIVAPGPGHLLQHLLHLVRIVGQRLDLILRQHVVESVAASDRMPPSPDRGRPHTLSSSFWIGSVTSRRLSPARTRTSVSVRASRSPGKVALDRVAARPAGSGAVATPWPSERHVRHTHRPRRRLSASDDHRGVWDHGAARILDDDPQRAGLAGLRGCAGRRPRRDCQQSASRRAGTCS